MNKSASIFLIFLLSPLVLSAQDIKAESIQWQSGSWFEGSAGVSFDYPTTITTSSDKIIWRFSGDSIKHDMTIRKTNGSWTDVASNGSMMFEADSGDDSAIVEFRKTSSRTFVRIIVAKPEETIVYELQITGMQVL